MNPKHKTTYVAFAGIVFALGAMIVLRPAVAPGTLSASALASQTPLAYVHPGYLEATAAILFDPATGNVLFGKNEERQLPLASLTKLATAALALDAMPADAVVQIEASDLKQEGDSGLVEGERWKLLSLVRFMLRSSSNDGAAAVARVAFPEGVEDMNTLALHLDLKQTYFLNPTGLDVSTSTSGAYGSALDVAKLFAYVLKSHPEALDLTVDSVFEVRSLDGGIHESLPTAGGILDMPGLLGAKTGFTDLAGGNLAVAFDQGLGTPFVAVVLGSSREGRFNDIRTLIKAVRSPTQ